jgi:hypothetical protein
MPNTNRIKARRGAQSQAINPIKAAIGAASPFGGLIQRGMQAIPGVMNQLPGPVFPRTTPAAGQNWGSRRAVRSGVSGFTPPNGQGVGSFTDRGDYDRPGSNPPAGGPPPSGADRGAGGPPPSTQKGAGSPPPPVQQSSGFTTPRINPMTGAAMQAPASPSGAGFNQMGGEPAFDRAALAESIAGQGWTNAGLTSMVPDDTAVTKNPFAESQFANAQFSAPGMASPGQPPVGFGTPGQFAGAVPEGMAAAGNAIGAIPNGVISTGFNPVNFEAGVDLTGGAQPAIDIVEAPGGATPEDAAQNMANATAGNVMSLQEMIRNRRVNLDG